MNHFIIQKYIEKPLLIYKRKFDIRVWVLVSNSGKCYFFKEGYLRTSGSEFEMDDSNPDDQYVHLTNNAIQKYSKTYGDFEDGNQMSFKAFQQYIEEHYPESGINFYRDCLPRMKEIIRHSLLSVRKKLNPNNIENCFELFGYDFIMDEDFNLWLIEVNTNPCLEESSKLLKQYLRRMVDDMIKLEIDSKFPNPRKKVNSPKKDTKKKKKKYIRKKIRRKSKKPKIISKDDFDFNTALLSDIEPNKLINTRAPSLDMKVKLSTSMPCLGQASLQELDIEVVNSEHEN